VKLHQLVFIDEFGAATTMARTRARGPRGQRVVCRTPHGHWMIVSTIAAMSAAGVFTACSFAGATDTAMFVAFVREFLAPRLSAGQVVVLDNLAAHHSPQVDALIAARGARVLRLPPYSPDFIPIEMAISKMKSLLRKLARRDVESLFDAIGQATLSITPADAIHFIKHCKYATDE
jgi:transposase